MRRVILETASKTALTPYTASPDLPAVALTRDWEPLIIACKPSLPHPTIYQGLAVRPEGQQTPLACIPGQSSQRDGTCPLGLGRTHFEDENGASDFLHFLHRPGEKEGGWAKEQKTSVFPYMYLLIIEEQLFLPFFHVFQGRAVRSAPIVRERAGVKEEKEAPLQGIALWPITATHCTLARLLPSRRGKCGPGKEKSHLPGEAGGRVEPCDGGCEAGV
jgi:hypothetical protein